MTSFVRIPGSVVEALPNLSIGAVKLALVLAKYAGPDGFAWPKLATITHFTGLKRRAIQNARNELQALGLNWKKRGPRGTIYYWDEFNYTGKIVPLIADNTGTDMPLNRGTKRPLNRGTKMPLSIYDHIEINYIENNNNKRGTKRPLLNGQKDFSASAEIIRMSQAMREGLENVE